MKTSSFTRLFASFGFLAVTLSPLAAQDRARDADHIGAYNFLLEIDGVAAGVFSGVEGLETAVEVIEFRDGEDLILRKRPGRTQFGNITLKRGYISAPTAQQWWEQAMNQFRHPRAGTVSIVQQNQGAKGAVRRWNLYGCWVKNWQVNGFDGKGNDVVTEEITFVCEPLGSGH